VKIAIFGGSFDPPHIGHETIINEALKQLDIERLIVVPTFLNPFKSDSFLDAKKRFFLLKKLFKNRKNIEISDYEILKNRAVFAIETVKHLQQFYKTSKIYLIIGADNLEKLHLWHSFEELNSMVEFVIANRSGFLNDNYANIKTLNVNINISATNLRDTIDLNYIPQIIKKDVEEIWQNK